MRQVRFEKRRSDDEDALAEFQQHLLHSRREERSKPEVTASSKAGWWQRFRQKPLARQIHDVSYVPLVAGAIGVALCAGLGGPTGLFFALGIVLVAALFFNVGSAMADKDLRNAYAQNFSCGMGMEIK